MTSGLLDTSVVIDWHDPAAMAALPDQFAISAITAAKLAAGPLLAATPVEAAKRQARLLEVESKLEPIPFDARAVRSYGLVVAAVVGEGRRPRSRFADLLHRRHLTRTRPGSLHQKRRGFHRSGQPGPRGCRLIRTAPLVVLSSDD